MSCNLQGICSWKRARALFFSSHIAMRFVKERPVTSKMFFWLGVHPTQLPHPDVSNQFWVHMAVDSGRKTTWYGRFYET